MSSPTHQHQQPRQQTRHAQQHPDPPTRSLIEVLGPDVSRCGYCARAHSSHAFGAWAHRLRVTDYQNLIDAGWRRSGRYLYRPDLSATCCPPFAIRLDAAQFTPSSTHRRVLKRLRRAANSESDTTKARSQPQPPTSPTQQASPPQQQEQQHEQPNQTSTPSSGAPTPTKHQPQQQQQQRPRPKQAQQKQQFKKQKQRHQHDNSTQPNLDPASRNLVDLAVQASLAATAPHADRSAIRVFPSRRAPSRRDTLRDTTAAPDSSPPPSWTCNAAHVLAAAERRAASPASHAAPSPATAPDASPMQGTASPQPRSSQDWAALLLPALRANVPAGWNVNAAAGFLNFTPPSTMPERDGSETCAMDAMDGVVPESVDDAVGAPQKPAVPQAAGTDRKKAGGAASASPPVSGAFSMQLVPAQYVQEAYELFRRYQMAVHKEERAQCGRETYRRFLVDTPLIREDELSMSTASGGSGSDARNCEGACVEDDEEEEEMEGDSGHVGYGSFHILYRLGGRLFAVGVVDILPKCLSSVYLFYDPDFARLSPGTLAALKEIEWVQTHGRDYPALRFYYMGFYIHGCAKMRYKAGFAPSELLCDETRRWVDAETARALLDAGDAGGGESDGDGAKRRPRGRLTSSEVSPARAASQFDIGDDEMDRLVGDSLFHIRVESGESHIVKLRTLQPLLADQWATQFDVLRGRLASLIRLVGRTASRAYEFLLWGQAQYGA